MNAHQRALGMPPPQNGVNIQDYFELIVRRKWWIIVPAVIGFIVAYAFSLVIPPVYRSSTLILVEPQKVPSSYVNPTVTSSVDDRLRTISQQIMSRTNLSRIIREYGLYKADDAAAKQQQSSGTLSRLRAKMQTLLEKLGVPKEVVLPPLSQDDIPEEVIGRMRRDIEVKVTGKEAFSVAYNGKEPHTVMRVTNTLALLFIEENLKVREKQAEGTSEFLESQLAEAERELQKLEKNLRDFQEKNRGALPAQLDANLRTLDRLQQELNAANDTIKSTELAIVEERRGLAEERRLIQDFTALATSAEAPLPTQQAVAKAPAGNPRVEALKQELSRLRATFNENYPDIVSLKKQIEEFSQSAEGPQEAQASASPAGAASAGAPLPNREPKATRSAPRTKGNTNNALLEDLGLTAGGGNVALERDLAAQRARREKIIAQIQDLERRVEGTPANDEKLTELTRDHSISLKSYQGLLEKRLNAKISENLEKKQKGEQFRILDPANFPRTPSQVGPLMIVGSGGGIGAGLGLCLALLVHFINPALRKPEDVANAFGFPVLATIPRYNTDLGRDHHLIVLQDSDSFVAEQYRILYTKLNDFSKEKGGKIFAITSALQSEGKTVTALNLAVVMAKDFGKKTLVLEGDFRRPTIPLYLKVELEEGLVDILSSKSDMQTTMVPVANTLVPFADDNLAVLPAVRRTQNSSLLLSSQRMRDLFDMLREQYDFILIDAPPILPLSDMNIFEEVVDGILLVIRADSTPRGAITKAVDAIGSAKIIGVVLNDVRHNLASYYHYGYRYGYKYKSERA